MSLGRGIDYEFNLDQEVQQHGIINFRGDLPTKWQRRFCIVKDSFLVIFKEDDAPRIKKSSYFNVKSQGIIPLGDCLISPYNDQTTAHGIEITANNNQMRQIISYESRSQQLAWIRALSDAARLTSGNFQISEQLITTLESQGLEKISLSEKYKKLFENESIKRQTQEEEATRLLTEFDQLRHEKESIESELHEIEAELASVRATTAAAAAAATAETVEDQKFEKIEETKEAAAADDPHEAVKAADTVDEEADAARRALASQLEFERAAFSRQASELAASLASLAEEQRARRAAEARLAEAEASLSRLDGRIAGEQTSYTPQEKQDMTSDVRQLKSYFESLTSSRSASSSGGGQQRPMAVRDRARQLREQRRSRLAPAADATTTG